jgi:excisionase family DNA binding protein
MKKQKVGRQKYLSIPDVASIMGMSRIAVYKQVKRGDIKSIKIGKTYGIPRSYINEISGKTLSLEKKKIINRAVGRVVQEYGELLRKLGNE